MLAQIVMDTPTLQIHRLVSEIARFFVSCSSCFKLTFSKQLTDSKSSQFIVHLAILPQWDTALQVLNLILLIVLRHVMLVVVVPALEEVLASHLDF